MKTLITGGSGLIGSYVLRNNKKLGEVFALSSDVLNVRDKVSIEKMFKKIKPDVVIHLGGMTRILNGELERGNREGKFWQTNVCGQENIVFGCLKYGAFLIYISGEVVFAGNARNRGPYSEIELAETDLNSLSWYGFTKAEAERIVLARIPDKSAIVRVASVVGSGDQPRPDYLRKIMESYDSHVLPSMFLDQYLGLADLADVSKVLELIAVKKESGIFHVSSFDQFTPYDLSRYLIGLVRKETKSNIKPASISEYLKQNPHTFFQYGGLSVKETEKRLSVKFSTWKKIVKSLSGDLKV